MPILGKVIGLYSVMCPCIETKLIPNEYPGKDLEIMERLVDVILLLHGVIFRHKVSMYTKVFLRYFLFLLLL